MNIYTVRSFVASLLILVSGCSAYSKSDLVNYELPLKTLIDSLMLNAEDLSIHIR